MRWMALAALLALAGCARPPLPANPALWEVDGAHGERGWLFGTIHTLPRPAAWRTPRVDAALAQADRLVVEIAALQDSVATAAAFQRLAHAPGQPPLAQRLPARLRPALAMLLARGKLAPDTFVNVKSWAAALMLGQVAEADSDSGNGIDLALLRDVQDKPVAELEGADRQFAIFDALPEAAQRDLIAQTVAGAARANADMRALADAWRRGDMAAITRETSEGMMADPALRDALYVRRGEDWAQVIAGQLGAGDHPFVAVGAAHMAGPDGLPALLTARGFAVRRIE